MVRITGWRFSLVHAARTCARSARTVPGKALRGVVRDRLGEAQRPRAVGLDADPIAPDDAPLTSVSALKLPMMRGLDIQIEVKRDGRVRGAGH